MRRAALNGANGKGLSPTEYLEQSLQSERGISEAVMARET